MDSLFELIKIKNSLPQGNVYKKGIKGHFYFYHQYRENGKNIIRQVSLEEAGSLALSINERKKIEKQIKDILNTRNKNLILSNSAKEYTGYVMSGDTVVAEFSKGSLIWKDDKLCPLEIKRTNSLLNFLKSRSIDSGRTNSRLLKKILNIQIKDDTLVALCSYAASISDNYWFKPKHSKLKYKDVSFSSDILFDTALKGVISIYPKKIVLSPELTTNGSYEKGWKNEKGKWWLYKVGRSEEIYSEMFYSRLFEELKLPTAHYEIEDAYIKTLNFSENYNFEPMIYLVGENDSIENIYNELNKIKHQIALDYLRLCVFDVVLNNVDRHSENCGVMRDRQTGEILSLAPNFDNNLSLISRNKELSLEKSEGFLQYFLKLISSNPVVKEALKETELPDVTEEMLDRVNSQINMQIDVNFDLIKKYVLFRYKTILEEIKK